MVKIHAVEFNTWMTLLKTIRDKMSNSNIRRYINVPSDNILPEYPVLSKFHKPSIIIQRVATSQSNMCFGRGFIGQLFDTVQNSYLDVSSRQHDMIFQCDIFCNNNTDNALLASIISEDILCCSEFTILDFTYNLQNPIEMGTAKIIGDVDIVPLNSNENNDYRTSIRFQLNMVQTIVPEQELVDLGKWIKVVQRVI